MNGINFVPSCLCGHKRTYHDPDGPCDVVTCNCQRYSVVSWTNEEVSQIDIETLRKAWKQLVDAPLEPKPFFDVVVHPSDAPALNEWIDQQLRAGIAERAERLTPTDI